MKTPSDISTPSLAPLSPLAPSYQRRPKVRYVFEETTEELSQAERVVKKFGGVPALIRALKQVGKSRSKATIYKWLYPKEKKGRNGLIPTSAWPDLLLAARLEGIHFSDVDFDPRLTFSSKKKVTELEINGVREPYVSRAEVKRAKKALPRDYKKEWADRKARRKLHELMPLLS